MEETNIIKSILNTREAWFVWDKLNNMMESTSSTLRKESLKYKREDAAVALMMNISDVLAYSSMLHFGDMLSDLEFNLIVNTVDAVKKVQGEKFIRENLPKQISGQIEDFIQATQKN